MPPRKLLPVLALLLVLSALVGSCSIWSAKSPVDEFDVAVVVYGASSGGIGAAVGAARAGQQVLLVEPTYRVGGMMTNGVTTDMFNLAASTGLFESYRQNVAEHYRETGLYDQTNDGLYAEPDVSLAAVEQLLDQHAGQIDVMMGWRLEDGPAAVTMDGYRLDQATFVNDDGDTYTVDGGVFIDASPEGDLLGAAGREGVDWVVGREGADVYDEQNAANETDRLQQAYNYRMTVQLGGRTDYEIPATYEDDRERYALVDPSWHERWNCTFTMPDGVSVSYSGIRIQRCLPNQKMDLNIELIGYNHDYPTAPEHERKVTRQRLKDFAIGWLHYLRTERDMPELGLPTTDFIDSGGFPTTLYVREGRRALGEYVFTEHDAIRLPDGYQHRLPQHPTSVAIGDYGLDSHCVEPKGAVSDYIQPCDGGFWEGASPYGVPFEVMVPRHIEGLLVPVPVSASHVGYSTLRMEPVRMNLGHAAGLAAGQILERGVSVRDVDVPALQDVLVSHGQALTFFSDLRPTHPEFAERQLAAIGGTVTLPDVGFEWPG